MVHEVVIATVDPAKRDEYVKVWQQAWNEANFEGSHGGKLLCCIEDPSRVTLVLNWDSVEAHQQHRGTDKHNRFREKFAPYQTASSIVQHYTLEDL
jgi:quinol monooxygenase YgiN